MGTYYGLEAFEVDNLFEDVADARTSFLLLKLLANEEFLAVRVEQRGLRR